MTGTSRTHRARSRHWTIGFLVDTILTRDTWGSGGSRIELDAVEFLPHLVRAGARRGPAGR